MSDSNSSVRNEQVDNTQGVADNTEPVQPVTDETPGAEMTGDAISPDPVAEPEPDTSLISEIHEADDPLHTSLVQGLTENETEDFHDFFNKLDDKHEIPGNAVAVPEVKDSVCPVA